MKFLALFLTCFYVVESMAQHPDKWELHADQDGVKIYHQTTPGLFHIKLTTAAKTPLAGVVMLFSDIDTYTSWGYKISEARLLERISETELYFYARYDFPWPMEDRDIILHSVIEQDPNTRVIHIHNRPFPNYLPTKAGITRIQNTTTNWKFTPGADGWVYMEQQISTDSAEGLPEWLVNFTIDTGPRETAKGVRKKLKQEQYQRAALNYIKE